MATNLQSQQQNTVQPQHQEQLDQLVSLLMQQQQQLAQQNMSNQNGYGSPIWQPQPTENESSSTSLSYSAGARYTSQQTP